MEPVVEVVAFLPMEVGICRACDLAAKVGVKATDVKIDGNDLAGLLYALSKFEVPARVTNPTSLRGLALMLRHGGKLPLVLVRGRPIHRGPVGNPDELVEKLERALSGG